MSKHAAIAYHGILNRVPGDYPWKVEALAHMHSKSSDEERAAADPRTPSREVGHAIDGAFTWDQQPQGREFWAQLCHAFKTEDNFSAVPMPKNMLTKSGSVVVKFANASKLIFTMNLNGREEAFTIAVSTEPNKQTVDQLIAELQTAIHKLEQTKYRLEYA